MGEKMTSRPRLPVFFASILVLVLGIWVFSGQAGETFLIKGAKVYTSSSRGTLEDAVLLIEGGKIGKIIRGDALPSFPVKDFSGTCIMPGMIDAHTYLSGYYRLLENTEPITSDMVAYAAFDPFHSEVRNALQSGITTVSRACLY
jgi:imidazolonepropionase-like amidohydrolase